jgi:membrane-bound PQQ-dependent dehydrogenase (glucose/quinate/shikimate family)
MTEQRGALLLRITAAFFLGVGLFMTVGGAWLLILGGSFFYLLAGLLTMASGALLWLRNSWGANVYEGTAALTLLWAIWQSGFDGWALVPRIFLPLLMAAWLFVPSVRRALHSGRDEDRDESGAATGAAAAIAIAFLSGAITLGANQLLAGEAPARAEAAGDGNWPNAGNDLGGSRYSELNQIDENNVGRLSEAWQFRTGIFPQRQAGQRLGLGATPIEVDDTLYFCTPNSVVIALNAENGAERWRFDPNTRTEGASVIGCRGVSLHTRAGTAACARRIVAATVDGRLFALDAATGRPCADFGGRGVVSLTEGLGEILPGAFAMTAPPLVVGNRVIVGGWVKFRNAPHETFGTVRAFDVAGRRLWTWDMGRAEQGARGIPQAPEPWTQFVADPALNMVYVPTGNDIPDFTAGRRTSYSNSIVALDLATGQPRWSFQTVRADRWNSDLAAPPALVSLSVIGATTPALVQATKQGQIFVLDRRSGKPLVDIADQRVPAAAPGDRTAPSQPVSRLSLTPEPLTESRMWGLTPLDELVCRIRFKGARYEGPFTPPGGGPSIAFPGHEGVIGAGGIAVDQINKLLVANTSEIPSYVSADGTSRPFRGPLLLPCTRPPWGNLHLIDLKTDRQAWRQKIGTFRDMGPFGIPSMLPFSVGTPNLGGPLVTRGALIFHAGTADNYLRAYNLFTGQELWSARLPAGGQAVPMTYSTRSGRQFVVVAAGGSDALGTSEGDYLLAYALPAAGN